jgi:hypothetical protein
MPYPPTQFNVAIINIMARVTWEHIGCEPKGLGLAKSAVYHIVWLESAQK